MIHKDKLYIYIYIYIKPTLTHTNRYIYSIIKSLAVEFQKKWSIVETCKMAFTIWAWVKSISYLSHDLHISDSNMKSSINLLNCVLFEISINICCPDKSVKIVIYVRECN